MKFKETLGIDVSKKTIDAYLYVKGIHRQFANTKAGYKGLLSWMSDQTGLPIAQVLICFEHTGLYSFGLAVFLSNQQITYSMVSALVIKRSLGLVRGKNDKIDAQRIAQYAYLRKEELKPFDLPSTNILKLQKLLSLRAKLVKQRADYIGGLKEYKRLLKQQDHLSLFVCHQKMIHYLSKQIRGIEQSIYQLIVSDPIMEQYYNLMISITGVGLILAANLLVVTQCFVTFKDGRKFACYAGIAPFERQSGTTLKTRAAVSHLANKKIKTLLNLAAFSAVQADVEIKQYYKRRIEQGKSKMSTLNIVRNKIVHRIFAVVKRGTPYVILNKHAA